MAPLSVAYYGTIRFGELTEWSVLVRVQEVLMGRCRATGNLSFMSSPTAPVSARHLSAWKLPSAILQRSSFDLRSNFLFVPRRQCDDLQSSKPSVCW